MFQNHHVYSKELSSRVYISDFIKIDRYDPYIKLYNPDKIQRYIDPSEDIYVELSNPLSPPFKALGIDKLLYAIQFLQYHRVKQIILKHQYDKINKNEFRNFLGSKVNNRRRKYGITKICSFNILVYNNRESLNNFMEEKKLLDLYLTDKIFLYLVDYSINCINKKALNKTFLTIIKTFDLINLNKIINGKMNYFDLKITPLDFLIIKKYKLWILILLHYGADINLLHENCRNDLYSMFGKERIERIAYSTLNPSEKLRSLITKESICPISLDALINPVIAEDGMIYEKENIIKYSTKKMISPITRQEYSDYPFFDFIKNRICER